MPVALQARYTGTCGRCKGPIKLDQWIEEDHWKGWVHWKKVVCRKIQTRRLSGRVSRFLDLAWNGRRGRDEKPGPTHAEVKTEKQLHDGGFAWYSATNTTKGDQE